MSHILPVWQQETPKRLAPQPESDRNRGNAGSHLLSESLTHCEPTFQTQALRLKRQGGAGLESAPLERSQAPEPGYLPEEGGVRVGLQIPETLLDMSFFRIGQRPVIQPFVQG